MYTYVIPAQQTTYQKSYIIQNKFSTRELIFPFSKICAQSFLGIFVNGILILSYKIT